jgi:hypothetical protein
MLARDSGCSEHAEEERIQNGLAARDLSKYLLFALMKKRGKALGYALWLDLTQHDLLAWLTAAGRPWLAVA